MVKAGKIVSIAAILLLAVLAVALSPTNASATSCLTDVWVVPPPLGNDGNPGTQAQPFATIQHGIDMVCVDGTVHVASGTYFENLHIGRSLNLVGSGAPTTIIDGDDDGNVIRVTSEIGQVNVISGFTIQNGHVRWGCGGMPVGGGVYVAMGHFVTLNDCTIKNNIADFLGGGVYNAGQITINRCTVSGNSAAIIGGGIANFVDEPDLESDGSMSLTNCTISGNSVGLIDGFFDTIPEEARDLEPLALGGGVYNGGNASFLNVTIANNTVAEISHAQNSNTNFFSVPVAYAGPIIPEPHGGGFANVPLQCSFDKGPEIFTPVATFKNTIVANNLPENGFNDGGSVISSGHNLDSENSCGFNQPSDLINTNPLLGPLQDNGGPTFTLALLEGSPAIDAGDNSGAPATDQRGITRPQGTNVDIGAFEVVEEAGLLSTTGINSHSNSPSNPNNWTRQFNPATLTVQFTNVNPNQVVANQPVTISTNVINTGDESGNLSVALKINGQVEQTRMISVGPQASQPIKFTVTKTEPGTYAVDVNGQTGSFTIPDTNKTTSESTNRNTVVILVAGLLVLAAIMVFVFTRRPA